MTMNLAGSLLIVVGIMSVILQIFRGGARPIITTDIIGWKKLSTKTGYPGLVMIVIGAVLMGADAYLARTPN